MEKDMVTTARRAARPVSLLILMMFAVGPGVVSAAPQLDAPAAAAVAADVAGATPIAAPSRLLATFAWSPPADSTRGIGLHPAGDSPRWLDTTTSASTPAKSGGWWSRRTTAQKTWIIVGIVAGAVGIYAIVNNGSGGGGGGSGY
jgi:hypothetical protein